MTKNTKKLLLIDANSLIHRSFHALPDLKNEKGEPTGALYGLINSLLKVLKDENPDYVGAAFDTPEDTFRKEMYEEYKAHRPETPEDLKTQLKKAHKAFEKLGIPTLKKKGFEADDILATLNEKFRNENNIKIQILTGDLDTLQLADNKTEILTPQHGSSDLKKYDPKEIKERYSLPPEKLADYKGLKGDSSDNIPGVPGIGEKTAQKILSKYSSLEEATEKIEDEENINHRIKKLADNKDQALLSKKLAILENEVPLEINLDELKFSPESKRDEFIDYLKEMNFKSLINRLSNGEEKSTETQQEDIEIFTKDNYLDKKEKLTNEKTKVAFHWKPIIKELKKENESVEGPLFDIKIAAWILDPDEKNLSFNSIADKFLNHQQTLLDDHQTKEETLEKLFEILNNKIKEKKLQKVFWEIDIPLIETLAYMELKGIKVGEEKLKELEEKINKKIKSTEEGIYDLAGQNFNINSPKQVGEILFEEIGIEDQGTTSSGQYKTSEEVLKNLKEEHEIVQLILKHRELTKMKSTYIKPILKQAKDTERIHAEFLQTTTATGRLSSQNPNMQNIPKGGKWAKGLRKSFVPEKGYSFVSFDYSQLELRLLAHVSGDQNMKSAFWEGRDIHKTTASKVLDLPIEEVTNEQRELAKTLNFGIVYGMGSRSFSNQTDLSKEESKEFINKYFEDFPKVKEWQEKTKNQAQKTGFVTNENGRRRQITKGWRMERAAINMPIQSLGADIIKIAMIKTHQLLKKEGLLNGKGDLILSIHDELLLEIADDILDTVIPKVKNILENETYDISVPLKVEVKQGKSWGDLKTK